MIAKLNQPKLAPWIEFAVKCNYLDVDTGRELYGMYNQILGSLVNMINNPSPWLMKGASEQ
ncbi:hypothetical protein NUACC21_72690 [Scytonema sp. NUACC21]